MKEISWEDVLLLDPFLAGSIAAREGNDLSALPKNLPEYIRDKFSEGFSYEQDEAAREEKDLIWQEYDISARGWVKGDPAR